LNDQKPIESCISGRGETAGRTPDDLPNSHPPRQPPADQSIESGPAAGSFQEILTLVGAGRGFFPLGAHMRRYYMRPDVAYVPSKMHPRSTGD
jgi:hypothetical protein